MKGYYSSNYIVVTMDCDGQYTVRDAKKLCSECLMDKGYLILEKRIRSGKIGGFL